MHYKNAWVFKTRKPLKLQVVVPKETNNFYPHLIIAIFFLSPRPPFLFKQSSKADCNLKTLGCFPMHHWPFHTKVLTGKGSRSIHWGKLSVIHNRNQLTRVLERIINIRNHPVYSIQCMTALIY